MICSCRYCFVTLDTERDSYTHIKIVNQFLQDNTQVFLCENCFTRFTSLQEITHQSDNCVKNFSSDKSFFCGYCSTRFKSLRELGQHLVDICRQKTYTNITLSSRSSDSYEQKSKRKHSNNLISLGIFTISKGNAVVFCEYCLTGFNVLQDFKQIHDNDTCAQRKHAKMLLSVPSSSSKSYEQKSERTQISSRSFQEHSATTESSNKNLVFLCERCSMEFKSLQKFIQHCDICV